ncbi:MAG: cyclopropane-fatty-acyl-phospholipid synthase family protein [Sphingorhabdus sp.]
MFGAMGGLVARTAGAVAAGGFHIMLDKIDRGLDEGSVEVRLPNGSVRFLGGRAAGPVAKAEIRSWRALLRLARHGSVGCYEGWVAEDWDSVDPVVLFELFVLNRKSLGNAARASGFARLFGKMVHQFKRNSKTGAKRNIEFHYDLGNDFYAAWLDESMTYSSAIFASESEALESAQARKIEALLDRLPLIDGSSLLEIGCGWGSLAEAGLRRHQIDYHGITLSAEQKSYSDQRLSVAGLAGRAEISLTDYRDVTGAYDAIASVEMVEAVGQEYWPAYIDMIARCLKPGGHAAIQYIRIDDDIFEAYSRSADFIQRYIFPGGMLLSESRFRKLAEERGLAWHDQADFGLDYARTLCIWRSRFDAAVDEGRLPAGFDEKFVRLWRFYLMYCEGGFKGGGVNVAQVTLVKE